MRRACTILIAALGVAACGTAAGAPRPSTPAHTATPAPSGPMLTGIVETSEDVSLHATFHAPIEVAAGNGSATPQPGLTCAAYATAASSVFVPPQFDVIAGGHSMYFAATATGFHGPGDYQSAGSGAITGTISVGVNVEAGEQPTYSIFRSSIGGSSAMTVRPNGSGTFSFAEWGSDEVRGNTGSAASISGELSWTCA